MMGCGKPELNCGCSVTKLISQKKWFVSNRKHQFPLKRIHKTVPVTFLSICQGVKGDSGNDPDR